jgi:hypothetical protein
MEDRMHERHRQAAGPASDGQPNAAQLRGDIDSGRTHDKVAHPDPAAAPLGTDAEASGSPPTGEQVATARRHETARDVPQPAAADQPHQRGIAPNKGVVWLIVGCVVVFAAIGIALAL